jgi:hypothetical protein
MAFFTASTALPWVSFPAVVLQGPADRKVQRMTKHVGTDTTRLGDEQCTRGVVPDLLLVLLAARVLCGYTQAKYQYMHVLWGR